MRILICGANGFVGAAIAKRLEDAGHEIIRGVRTCSGSDTLAMDFERDIHADCWRPRLRDVSVVINTVGLLTAPAERLVRVHTQTPVALFDACVQAGVQKVIQISALGVDGGNTPYFETKSAADAHLASLPLEACVVRPSLIYGPDGTSAQLFRALASLPFQCLPGGGLQRLQPIHIDDLSQCVLRLVQDGSPYGRLIELAGNQIVTWKGMLASYRAQMGFAPAPTVSLPAAVMPSLARVFRHLPGALLTPETWEMLSRHNVATHNVAPELLGHPPRAVDTFMETAEAGSARNRALATWRPLLWRTSLAAVWLVTAWVSGFVYPQAASLDLLGAVGLSGPTAYLALYGAVALDAVLGLATLFRPGRRLWWFQIVLILAYTTVIALALPAFLVHPFGPVLKNLAVLALLVSLLSDEASP